ncbi:MAG TPA: hypothetical protein PKM56_18480 [Candidatus Rifleibacterium sp.]|nr:hypothetical protein [Candidatus Rifleibacterium sp.]
MLRMEDREREAFDMAVIRGTAFKQGKLVEKISNDQVARKSKVSKR